MHDSDLSVAIQKRHGIGVCTHRCIGIFFDFDKFYRERGVVLGGMWPNQWIALRTNGTRPLKTKPIELPPERPPSPTPIWVDDEDAIAEAIRQSLEMMPLPPQPKGASGSKPIPKLKESSTSADGPMICAAQLRSNCSKTP